jgi:hypothetical protein
MTGTRTVEVAFFQGLPVCILASGAILSRIKDSRGNEFSVRNSDIKIKVRKVHTNLPG